ncbi:15082_t:CDS:2, partial [Entrophospora sp. SA101]
KQDLININNINNPNNPNIHILPASIPMQPQQPNPAIQGILRILLFFEYLAAEMSPNKKDISYWRRTISEFFTEGGRFFYSLQSSTDLKNKKSFDLPTPLIARFFQVNFDSGVNSIQITMNSVKESLGNQLTINNNLENKLINTIEAKSQMIYNYANGSRVVFIGRLRIRLNLSTMIEYFEFLTDDYIEYVPRNIETSCLITEYGITMKTLRCLEVAEIVVTLNDIISMTIEQKKGPQHVLYHPIVPNNQLQNPPLHNLQRMKGIQLRVGQGDPATGVGRVTAIDVATHTITYVSHGVTTVGVDLLAHNKAHVDRAH